MRNTFAKTKTKLMVLLMVVAIVALSVALAFTAFNNADAEAVTITVDSEQAFRNAITDVKSKPAEYPDGAIIKLNGNLEVLATIEINCSVTLDLNGYVLSYIGSAAAPVITVTDNANFTLTDSRGTTDNFVNGVGIKGGAVTGGKEGGVYVTKGNFTFEGGTIAGNVSNSETRGGGVTFASAASTFTMRGTAVISYNSALLGGGVFVLGMGSNNFVFERGTIQNNTATINGGGVYLTGGQSNLLEMKGGSIANNKAVNGNGGGIFVARDITAIISNGEVRSNSAVNGGGVYLENGALTMNGGAVSENSTSHDGAGVYSKGGNLTVTGGDISNNTANTGNGAGVYLANSTFILSSATISSNQITSYGNGAGVYMEGNDTVFTMTSGSIVNNLVNASGNGGGVYFAEGTLNIKGSPVINGNKIAGNKDNNLYLYGSQTFVTVTGAISGSANIGVTVDSARTFTKGYKTAGNTAVNGFSSDNSEWKPSLDNGGELTMSVGAVMVVTSNSGTTYYADIEKGWAELTAANSTFYKVQLLADVETTGTLTVSAQTFVLDLNGYMIRNTTTTANVITVQTGAGAQQISFTLMDSRPEAAAHEIEAQSYGIVPTVTSPTVKIYGGVIAGGIRGIEFSDSTSGYIHFSFESGTVAGATTCGLYFKGENGNSKADMYSGASVRYVGSSGDAVLVVGKQSFTMHGGDISYNSRVGMSLATAGTTTTLTMYDGRITNNGQSGVYAAGTQTVVNIYGGDISYNGYTPTVISGTGRSGIYINRNAVKVTMSGGTITHNAGEGIGAFVAQSDISNTNSYMLIVTGGEISYNGYEGIMLVQRMTLNDSARSPTAYANAKIENAAISYNGYDGIWSGSTLKITNSTLISNGKGGAAAYCGHNIHTTSGTAEVRNCIIKDAGSMGVYFTNTNAKMYEGEISDNRTGVQVAGSTVFTMYSGEIKNNHGSAILTNSGTFIMEGGSIHDNTDSALRITTSGGNKVNFTLNSGEIYNNKATNGAGILITGASTANANAVINITINDGVKIYNNTATGYGGGVYINKFGSANFVCNFIMNGGEITDNTALYGGGVAVNPDKAYATSATIPHEFQMNGGRIENNQATYGGGVYYGANATMQMSGELYITNNVIEGTDTPSNLYVCGDAKVTIGGEIVEDSVIGLTIEAIYNGKVLTTNYNKGANSGKNPVVKGFVLDVAHERLGTTSDEVVIMASAVVEVNGQAKGSWSDAWAAVTSGATIKLLTDVGVQDTITFGDASKTNLTLDLNGKMLQFSNGNGATKPLILVSANVTLTITDSTYVNHEPNEADVHRFINPVTESREELYGGVIHGNVKITAGTVNFNAGNVVNGLSTFTYGSSNGAPTINHNVNAFGVYVAGGAFNFNSGAAICYNRDSGIYHEGGTTTIDGGKIFGNVSFWGAGLSVLRPNCTLRSGEIYGNKAQDSVGEVFGGGVAVMPPSGEFTMTGGTIHDNVVVCRDNSTLGTKSLGAHGAGIEVRCSSSGVGHFTMSGGSIVNNKVIVENGVTGVPVNGAGIDIENHLSIVKSPMLTLTGGTIVVEGNTLNGVESNIGIRYNNTSAMIAISGSFNDDSRIGISLNSTISTASAPLVFTKDYNTKGGNTQDNKDVFFADDPTQCLTYNAGELQLRAHTAASLKHTDMQMATCTVDGHPEYWECETCNRKFVSINPFVDYDEERDNTKGQHKIDKFVWSNNGEHVGVCSVCGKQDVAEAHVPSNWKADGTNPLTGKYQHSSVCTICNGKVTLDCSYEDNQKSDDTYHWLQCTTCGEHYDEAKHEVNDDAWTMRNNGTHRGTCKDCGYTEVIGEHELGEGYTLENSNDSVHYQVCRLCGFQTNEKPHDFEWTEVEGSEGQNFNGVCADCGYQKQNIAHKWSEKRTSDGKTHWFTCTLEGHDGEKYDEQECVIVWDTSITSQRKHKGACSDPSCGYTIEEADCEFGAWFKSESGHFRECEICGQKDATDRNGTPHTPLFFSNTKTHGEVCSVCGYVISETEHNYEWTSNETHHYQVCTDERCGATGERAAHSWKSDFDRDAESHWRTCTQCQYESEHEKHDSEWVRDENGHSLLCESCGYGVRDQAHEYGTAWYTNAQGEHYQICADCEYQGNKGPHQYTVKGDNLSQGTHKVTCSVCGDVSSEACTYGSYTYEPGGDSHTATCIYCHDEVTTKHTLVMNSTDAEQHWEECECGYVNEESRSAHDFGENNELDNCKVCGRALNDPLAEKRRSTRASITAKAEADIAGLAGSNKATYEAAINVALDKYLKDISSATTAEQIEQAEANFNAEVNAIVLLDKKDVANVELEAKAQAERDKLAKEDLSADEMAKYEQAIQDALDNAQKNVNNATDVEGVARNLEQGKKDIEQNILKASKEIAKDKVQQEADAKKDEIQDKVDNGEMSQEDADRLKDVIDREAERAQGKIDDATSREEVAEEQQRGDDVIGDIVKNPDPELQEKKSDDRDALDDNAQAKKDEIDEKVKNGELTPEQGKELKDKVDEETKKAQDKVTEATTPEESEKAKNEGMANQDEVSKPDNKPGGDKEPEKDSWFKRLFNSDLPLGYFGIALGVLLFIIIILAIAARKPKKK